MISVAELMGDPDFGAASITLRRGTRGMQEGESVATNVDSTITALVQPADRNDIKKLPEGDRLQDVVSVWSATEMQVSPVADVLVVGAKHYRVIALEPWGEAGYYRAFAEGFSP